MKFWDRAAKEHPVLRAARSVGRGDPQSAFSAEALGGSHLLFATAEKTGKGWKPNIAVIDDGEGREWVGAFTDEAAARRWGRDVPLASLPSRDLLEIAVSWQLGVLLDPAGPQRVALEYEALRLLLAPGQGSESAVPTGDPTPVGDGTE